MTIKDFEKKLQDKIDLGYSNTLVTLLDDRVIDALFALYRVLKDEIESEVNRGQRHE
jgi:hypothetical protein